MRNRLLSILFLLLIGFYGKAQELFIHTEPASSIPKGVLSYRYSMETYEDEHIRRHWHALRLFYGLTSHLTLTGTVSISNHHPNSFPPNPWAYFNNHHSMGYDRNYPLEFEGFHLKARYRVFTLDEENEHLRIALFGEASSTNTAHDEAEPHLLGDNSGLGGGLIVTKLIKKFAISATAGYIHPFTYKEEEKNLTFRSGNAQYMFLSMGYLLYPKEYKSYSDLNVNIYLETLYKEYDAAQLHLDGKYEFVDMFPYLQAGKYVEVRPGLQFVMNSKSRLDISAGFTVYGNTFIRKNPTVFLSYQKYLFR